MLYSIYSNKLVFSCTYTKLVIETVVWSDNNSGTPQTFSIMGGYVRNIDVHYKLKKKWNILIWFLYCLYTTLVFKNYFATMMTKKEGLEIGALYVIPVHKHITLYIWIKFRSRSIRISIEITYIDTFYGSYRALKVSDRLGLH